MGTREFDAWVDQMAREVFAENNPHSWEGTAGDPFWQRAAEKRRKLQGH